MALEPCPDFDLYATLAVAPDAPAEVILAAHRALIRMVHPDLHAGPGALDAARRLNVARDWLADPERRAAYDGSRRGRSGVPAHHGPRTGTEPPPGPEPGQPPEPWQPCPRDLNVRLAAVERFADECAALGAHQLRRIAVGHAAAVCGHDPDLAAAADGIRAACRRGGLERLARLAADDASGRLCARVEVPPGVTAAIGWMTAALLSVDVADRESAIVQTRWRVWTEPGPACSGSRVVWWRRWLSTVPAPDTGEDA